MHVGSAEGGVSPLPCLALPIRVNHSWNTKWIFRIVPAKSHHHVWRVLTIDLRLIETECPLHRFLRENDSGKICLLQKFNQPTRNRRIIPNHVKKNGAAVSNQHNLSGFRLVSEF